MFFPVKNKDGKQALINLDQIFAFVEQGSSTIAVSVGGTTFEIPMKLEFLVLELDAVDETVNDDTD